jgi:peptidylprolyl isomerase
MLKIVVVKALGLIIALSSVLAIAGCGGSDQTSDAATEPGGTAGSSTRTPAAELRRLEAAEGPKPEIPRGPKSKKLIVTDLRKGTGAAARVGDELAVHYVLGLYETGEEIGSGWVKGEPFVFELGAGFVHPAWKQGLPGMRVGGRRELVTLATRQESPVGSRPGDALVYVVDLLAVE